jgi:hypothetical protein
MTPLRWLSGLAFLGLPFALTAAQESPLAIRGTVTDSVHRAPLVGAKVIASRTVGPDDRNAHLEFAATTDANGRFELTSLAPAVYLVTVEHPWLDSTGVEIEAQTVDLRDRHFATLSLAVPSGKTIRSAFCPPVTARDSTLGLVEGFVRDAQSDQPVAAVRVLFAWSDFTVDRRTGRATRRHHTVAASTARDGSFAVCGLPVSQNFLMQAQIGDRAATGAVEVVIPPGGVLVETLRIATNKAGTASVSGEVRGAGARQLVAGAHVHVFGTSDEVVTADDGSFHLNDVPIGTQSIEVTALGLRPRRYAVDVRPDGASNVIIAMTEMAQPLDTVRTIAKSVNAAALREEFDRRTIRGTGQYITEDMIARTHPWLTSDLIRYARGFEFKNDTVFSTRGDYEVGGTGVCKPVLLIDGNPADSMNEVMPIAIHGIEIYASSINVPLKYPSSACGAIFIWTK